MTAKRRGQGEGAVYQRPDKRWCAQLDLGWESGKRNRKTIYAATKREALAALGAAREAHRRGVLPTGGRRTTGDYLARWIEDKRQKVRPSTFRRYADIVNLHLIPSLDKVPLEKLSWEHVEAMCKAKLQSGMAPRSVHHIRAVLRVALNKAVKTGALTRNAAALADPVDVPARPMSYLTAEQAQHLLDSVHGDPTEALYAVALTLGMRQGEILGLQWGDVDLDGRRLTVAHALQRVEGLLRLVPLKTKRSARVLSLPAITVEALRVHRGRQMERRLLAGGKWSEWQDPAEVAGKDDEPRRDTSLVFTTAWGTPLDGCVVTATFHRALARAGLPRIRFHDLRHSAASMLFAQHVPMKLIQEILGHSTITLTANTYTHLADAARQEGADAMDRALSPRG